ncbi:hypothetical protein [Streptomyces sp. NPDC050848]|uniref:hypothetical protein n=1 Tax=Streptomyces sp. NPDC050848 TaxID=3155791 RepID=UPI0033C81B24
MSEPRADPPQPAPEPGADPSRSASESPRVDSPRSASGPPGADPSHPAPGPPGVSFIDKAAYVVAPGTAVIGLLYYFGSVYTDAYYTAFGVPSTDLQLSVQAYLAKSPEAVFGPVWFLLICGLAVLLVLGRVGHVLARPGKEGRRRTVCRWFLVVGLLMALLGFPVFFGYRIPLPLPESWWGTRYVPPLVVALGATLAFFAVRQRLQRSAGNPDRHAVTAERMWSAGGALLIGLLAMSLFFGTSQYVADSGETDAWTAIEGGHVDSLPVVVYSRIAIVHHAKGITHQDMGTGKDSYRYQYTGFRLLVKSPSRFYLVSHASRYADHLTVVLPDDDTVRVELTSAVR